ncbi:PIG-L family deacetylase [Rhodococcus pyridinivorans]|uniref:PIG-L family deacetylase n=1 Tax=Rhodococcus pyridinivorans TaxID=103816 RepID=UPI003D7F1F79
MMNLCLRGLNEIAILGAHGGDIALGLGGTLLGLVAHVPQLRIRTLLMSGEESRSEIEERHALAALCPNVDIEVSVLDVPAGHAPLYRNEIGGALESFRRRCTPDVLFVPHRESADEDHRVLAEVAGGVFPQHLTLEYEVFTPDAEAARLTIYQPLTRRIVEEKARILLKHYSSLTDRDWFDEQAFLGLARLRGVQCHHQYAEAFSARSAVVHFDQL